jgi:hypothetical protein
MYMRETQRHIDVKERRQGVIETYPLLKLNLDARLSCVTNCQKSEGLIDVMKRDERERGEKERERVRERESKRRTHCLSSTSMLACLASRIARNPKVSLHLSGSPPTLDPGVK